MVRRRYIISTRRTGLGDRLVSLGAAWRFARGSGRILVADWRFSAYSPDTRANLFTLCFEGASDLAGVPFIGDDSVGSLGLPGNPGRTVLEAVRHRLTGCRRLSLEEAERLLTGGRDIDGRGLLLDSCIADGSTPVEESRAFLSALRPVPRIASAVAAFRGGLGEGPVIGLHIRHGNGGDVMDHGRFWSSFQPAIARCVAAVRHARTQFGPAAIVLLCTDSAEVEHAIKESVTGVVTRKKIYRDPGDGELHLWRGAFLVRDDAMIEMLLLAECDALIRYPPRSFFSFYAAVMKPSRERRADTMRNLENHWDPADPLSPAILF